MWPRVYDLKLRENNLCDGIGNMQMKGRNFKMLSIDLHISNHMGCVLPSLLAFLVDILNHGEYIKEKTRGQPLGLSRFIHDFIQGLKCHPDLNVKVDKI